MKLAVVGLGRMGANMALRLARGGHSVIIYNRTAQVASDLAATQTGLTPVYSLQDLVQALDPPRVIWLMVPAGEATEQMLTGLAEVASQGDIFVDGGNSNFKDTLRRAEWLAGRRIHFIDVGVSGGIWGLKEGYSLMIGGNPEVVDQLNPVFETLAPGPDRGWGRVGPQGAGHYVKMVHNGIEYGMMEALAEGFEILQSRQDFNLDLHQVATIWEFGSVVRSWLLELTADALGKNPNLEDLQPWVADSGEGRWTVFEAIDQDIPAPVITLALIRRLESRQPNSFAARLLAAMRNEFGGHAVLKKDDNEAS